MKLWRRSSQKPVMLLFMAKNMDNQIILLLNNWGVAKRLFIIYLNNFIKLVLPHQKKKTGHPPLLNTPSWQELKAFVQENGENRWLCAKKLATVWTAHTKKPISAFTICRTLKKVRLSACIPHHKPAITEVHCQAHLKWAHAHEKWTTRQWRKVLFSDKSTFIQFQQERQGKV